MQKGNMMGELINTSKGSWFRGNEILAYLKSNKDVENYVILDDTFF